MDNVNYIYLIMIHIKVLMKFDELTSNIKTRVHFEFPSNFESTQQK